MSCRLGREPERAFEFTISPTCASETPMTTRVEWSTTAHRLPNFPDSVLGAGGIVYDVAGTGTCQLGSGPVTCSGTGTVAVTPRPTF
jgi:hypothetical protein